MKKGSKNKRRFVDFSARRLMPPVVHDPDAVAGPRSGALCLV